ncbi:RusA family crossover junction endodeoxyribonuclease [Methylobacterium sp.]|jgi:Holliday junction resolvase RusA-like endonuclease|uniref:RusA family crossover junction endodeoxyribonuclease n=1 Tax=Methylobacterium sp. TaxID=409 RepID=UPI000C5101C8|nr:RusA family crossover junction endodeoxyribonuclease [Methylobacterium sp.]MBP27868.1 hypothetical protein [Methylobacterium sp.]
MPSSVTIRLPGPPQGKQRHRSRVVAGKGGKSFASQYSDPKTVAYERRLRAAATVEMDGAALLSGMLSVAVFAFMPIPASWPKRKQQQARDRLIRPVTKPDWDNVAKVTDALNGVVWGDDASVVDGYVRKFYADEPELVVQVSVVVPEAA